MYHMPPRQFGASARYQDVDVAMRVQGASPHGLVAILFDELAKGLDVLIAADRNGVPGPARTQARALSILHGLEGSLDFEQGGDIAHNLARIYREARRLVANAGEGRGAALAEARTMVAEIAGAWAAIG